MLALLNAELLLVTDCGIGTDVTCVFRLGEPVCLGAGPQPVGGGGTAGDGVSALQQVQTVPSARVRSA